MEVNIPKSFGALLLGGLPTSLQVTKLNTYIGVDTDV
jgi:hypothetical protein